MAEKKKDEKAQKFLGAFGALDEAVEPLTEKVVARLAAMMVDQPTVRAILGRISPVSLHMIADVGPVVFGWAIGTLFPSNSPATGILKDALIHFITRLAEEMEEHQGGLTADDANRIFDEILNKKLVVDPLGHVHRLDCPELARDPRRGNWPQITMERAIAGKLLPAVCCSFALQEELKKPTAPTKNGRVRSVSEAIDSLGSEADKEVVLEWTATLTADQTDQLIANLDSAAEVRVLVRCINKKMPVDQVLRLLENHSPSAAARRATERVGQTVKNAASAASTFVADQAQKAGKAVKDAVAAADVELDPLAGDLEKFVVRATSKVNTPRKRSLLSRIFWF